MIWVGILVFSAAGAALIAARRRMSEMQSLFAGGRIPSGCVVIQGVAMLLFAFLIFLFRAYLE
jgi:hypothetical protein